MSEHSNTASAEINYNYVNVDNLTELDRNKLFSNQSSCSIVYVSLNKKLKYHLFVRIDPQELISTGIGRRSTVFNNEQTAESFLQILGNFCDVSMYSVVKCHEIIPDLIADDGIIHTGDIVGFSTETNYYSNILKCSIHSFEYIYMENKLILKLTEGQCVDTDGAIKFAKDISHNIKEIETWSGEIRDTSYIFVNNEWKILCP